MKAPKAYFIDIDGTLTNAHNSSTINNIDEKAIKATARDGAYVVLTTGRDPKRTIPIWEQIDSNREQTRYIICNNGSVIIDKKTDEIIFEDYIEELDFVVITELLYNRGFVIKNSENSTYYAKRNLRSSMIKWFSKVEKSLEGFNYNNVSARKIGCISYLSKHKVKKLANEIMRMFPGIEVSISGPGLYIEITKKGVNKGSAIEFLTKHIAQFNIEDTCHIGDSMNDSSAFDVVGTSVALSSAMKDLKKKADFITGPISRNGVSKALDSLRQKRK